MRKYLKFILPALVFAVMSTFTTEQVQAQTQQLYTSQQFRLGERLFRIAEPGELVDSVNVWGDVGSAGRYLVPKGTSLANLITYSLGPRTLQGNETQIDWSKMRIEINVVSDEVDENGEQIFKSFTYHFEEPFPEGMREFMLENNQTVAIRVKRRPAFRDYLSIVASTLSALATTIILLDRLSGK